MTNHVLDDHNGIVDKDADTKDERKEGDAIQGVAVEVERREGQGQRYRNG